MAEMTFIHLFPPHMPRLIEFLLFPNFQLLDAAGPIAAFEIAGRFGAGAYKLRIAAAAPGAIASTSGATMHADAFARADKIDTLIVAGGEGTRPAALDARIIRHVRACAERSRRVASVCSGAYILAQAGLLDGKVATTHWSRTEDFARRFPRVNLQPDRIFTQCDNIWTSAGITAGIDLSLALIADDLGEDIARKTAQQLVVYRRRPGGQSQFSALLEIERPNGRFADLLDYIRGHLSAELSVAHLASRAAMSERTFARAFHEETGMTPAKAVERLRAEAARAALESGARSVQAVARETGFGDPERMRRAFARLFGSAPSALKRA